MAAATQIATTTGFPVPAKRSNVALNKVKDKLAEAKKTASANAKKIRAKLSVDGIKIASGVAGGVVGAVGIVLVKGWAIKEFPQWSQYIEYGIPIAFGVIGGAVALTSKNTNVQYLGIGVAISGAVMLASIATAKWKGTEGTVMQRGAKGTVMTEGTSGWEEEATPIINADGLQVGSRKLLRAVSP